MSDDFDGLLFGRSGPPAAKFPKPGDFVEGTLVSKDTQQAAEFNAKDPTDRSKLKTYDSGDPKLELILILQTDVRDPNLEDDKGVRRVFVSYSMQQSLQQAVLDAGIRKSLPLGSRIRIEFSHEVPNKMGSGNPRKEYKISVTPPADLVAVGGTASGVVAQGQKVSAGGNGLTPAALELLKQNGYSV